MDEFKDGFWVFGYGSLLWNPEFDFVDHAPATLIGYARSFCMWSIHHRGSVEVPGLVLALDAQTGATCRGVAFQVGADTALRCLADLRERELVSSAYFEHHVDLRLDDGREVTALAYVIDPEHEQYTGPLTLDRQADIIASATGGRGPNSAYLFNTAAHLTDIGMEDAELTTLADKVRMRLQAKS
ncbi:MULTISPECIES: gamma-glutamylcyclotransferase [Pacificibacter]|uniref:gamma-glutamylcyclotransferase n=1 Tax=Pacificibacter TaxID=1042323 RepID=UPI001C099869|nr:MULTISPECIES: gamma-glutamylcyclotransferase [Pacificibacter]MBU2934750.1 gamma-glutamylcyclotransferase [Pacificibacter marinus]MDO6615724.1 gamma-glutamylcyclotransferase [Pacificibacter sp. 1_MG-2023]